MNEEFRRTLENWKLDPGQEALDRIGVFVKELVANNAVMNLISKKDEDMVWTRHIADSLAAAGLLERLVKKGGLVADSGTGAGFPGVPLAAVLPELRFELLDSNGKRCLFIGRTLAEMKLTNAAVFQRRVGEGPRVEKYRAVTERAMGQLENILPQCLNMLLPGGVFLAWQSAAQMAQDRPEVSKALRKGRGELAEKFAYRLPGENEDRYIAVFRKN